MHASTSSLAVALVASASLFATQAEALPMTRSSSTVARRAHLASHHHATRASAPTAKDLNLGDHAIVVDASSSGSQAQGGIKNSTINLTSISHQTKRDSTLSGFSRVVRSLFGGASRRRSSAAAAAADNAVPALPLTFSPSAPVLAAPTVAAHASAAVNPKRSKRANKNTHASSKQRRARPRNFGKHPRPPVNLKRRATADDDNKATLVVPVAARYITRQVKRAGATYTEAVAQASIYSAAIAALPETTPTAAAVPMDSVAPTVAAYIDTPAIKNTNSGSPYSGSALDAPNGSYGNAAAARAQKFSASASASSASTPTLSWASVAGSTPASAPVPTSTPLVSVDANGIAWVRASALATPEPFALESSTVINPKAALVAISSSATTVSALPTSPPPSTMTGR
ncbi:hypothetical protein JCM3774_001772 [Rhodotorula dairenensis]